jgi:hypothetical protein
MRIGVFPFSLLSFANIYSDPSEYAKLGMAPLWLEIMENIVPWLREEDFEVETPRLAVFSGHDTTIMPLLASLGPKLWNDTDWAPYASMLVIEVRSMYGHCVFQQRHYCCCWKLNIHTLLCFSNRVFFRFTS